MVFTSMDLAYHTAYPRPIIANYYEEIFGHKTQFLIYLNDFNMRESLAIRTDFILAFYDKNTSVF